MNKLQFNKNNASNVEANENSQFIDSSFCIMDVDYSDIQCNFDYDFTNTQPIDNFSPIRHNVRGYHNTTDDTDPLQFQLPPQLQTTKKLPTKTRITKTKTKTKTKTRKTKTRKTKTTWIRAPIANGSKAKESTKAKKNTNTYTNNKEKNHIDNYSGNGNCFGNDNYGNLYNGNGGYIDSNFYNGFWNGNNGNFYNGNFYNGNAIGNGGYSDSNFYDGNYGPSKNSFNNVNVSPNDNFNANFNNISEINKSSDRITDSNISTCNCHCHCHRNSQTDGNIQKTHNPSDGAFVIECGKLYNEPYWSHELEMANLNKIYQNVRMTGADNSLKIFTYYSNNFLIKRVVPLYK